MLSILFSTFLKEVGKYLLMLKSMFGKPESAKMYWKEFMHQCSEIGIGTLPIVLVISVFLGAVTTVQTAYQLVSPLIPPTTIAVIVRESMILELSPTVLSIVLAGVVGSKIASDLGNMRVSEQIDALEMMGVNPAAYLVLPKVAASILIVPCLVIISFVVGILGGREAGAISGIIDGNVFDMGIKMNFVSFSVTFALIKTYVFAFLISTIPSYFGYYVKGGSLEIGRASTQSVVVCCIAILLMDYVLAALLL